MKKHWIYNGFYINYFFNKTFVNLKPNFTKNLNFLNKKKQNYIFKKSYFNFNSSERTIRVNNWKYNLFTISERHVEKSRVR